MLKGYYRRTGLYGRFRSRSVELKFFDRPIARLIDSYVSSNILNSLNVVDQGTGPNQMLGNKIVIKKIIIRLSITKSEDSAATLAALQNTLVYRLMLVQDKQANGVAATLNDVLDPVSVSGNIKMENSRRFNILKEWMIPLTNEVFVEPGAILPYSSGKRSIHITYSKRCNIPIEFSAMAGTSRNVTEVKSNNLLLLGTSYVQQQVSETEMIDISGYTRIRFEDN